MNEGEKTENERTIIQVDDITVTTKRLITLDFEIPISLIESIELPSIFTWTANKAIVLRLKDGTKRKFKPSYFKCIPKRQQIVSAIQAAMAVSC